ncbi:MULTISPECIES: DUF2778 domain-containing protein [unclassified Mesorhizobium]|uniref:DUF2778 domain-containing protein n=1 Tax=unclassified Mesorhizobium TaxID=325217 RepID=UPI00301440BC
MRPLLVTSVGIGFAGAAVWSVAGMVAMNSSFASNSGSLLPKPQFYGVEPLQARLPQEHGRTGKAPRLVIATAQPFVTGSIAAGPKKSARHPEVAAVTGTNANAARFDAIVKNAALTSKKLASLFDAPNSGKSARTVAKGTVAKAGTPAQERFATLPAATEQHPTLLAYADPSPGGAADAALSALLAPPLEDDLAASQNPDLDTGEDAASLPDYENTPSDGPLPQLRPRYEQARKPVPETEKPDVQQADEPAAPKPDEQPVRKADEPKKADERAAPKPQKLAYARPSDPGDRPTSGGGFGRALQNLFGGGARAGGGVAVYDISAAKVYMPDGSVLEAHSGVGKMADDPRYVNVKMNGPTPPHTYNLKMRESRFHGVEAIRMLPVDGRNKYGRDGFLTHSYLLRGRQAESHGCVAFKDYERFLTAFKKGKVKQLVVVPSGGRSTMVASNG